MTNRPTLAAVPRPASFDEQLTAALPRLRCAAYKYAYTPEDREDLLQETMATALRRWESYVPSHPFFHWLLFTMREVNFRDKRKSIRNDAIVITLGDELEATLGTPPDQMDTVVASEITNAIETLGKDKGVMSMLAAGAQQIEIAEVFGISRQAIGQRVERGRSNLARKLRLPRFQKAA